MPLTWRAPATTTEDGVTERGFHVDGPNGTIPGIAWAPADVEGRRPLVLMGHGGRRNKEMLAPTGRRLAAEYGMIAAGIDAPDHGERGPITPEEDTHYRAFWANRGVERAVEDWHTTLDALVTLEHVDADRIGWSGLSMGTLLGLPFVVTEPRVRVAVLGLAGYTGSSAERSMTPPHLKAAAPRLSCPTLFVMNWDDERFETRGQLDLYADLAAGDKRLLAYPGMHGQIPEEGRAFMAVFLAGRLLA